MGLNHLSWERAVRVDGVDRAPDLLERYVNRVTSRPAYARAQAKENG